MTNMKTPDYHNPQNVPESDLKPGERLLLKEEVNSDLVLRKYDDLTYKTTLPLPAEYLEPDYVFLKEGDQVIPFVTQVLPVSSDEDKWSTMQGGFTISKCDLEVAIYRNPIKDLNKPVERDWTAPEAQAECRRLWAENPAMERDEWNGHHNKWMYSTNKDWRVSVIYRPHQPAPKPPPEVNWSAMPAWAEWVAMAESGTWTWFAREPNLGNTIWVPQDGNTGIVDALYTPKFTGDWKDSLARRGGAA